MAHFSQITERNTEIRDNSEYTGHLEGSSTWMFNQRFTALLVTGFIWYQNMVIRMFTFIDGGL